MLLLKYRAPARLTRTLTKQITKTSGTTKVPNGRSPEGRKRIEEVIRALTTANSEKFFKKHGTEAATWWSLGFNEDGDGRGVQSGNDLRVWLGTMTRLFTTVGLITKVDAVDALEVFDNCLQELEER